jgi:hypothetical protein
MTTDNESHAAHRLRLLAVSAALLEALYQPGAVPVLATLKPADMRPGGARVLGTSYELEAATAARAMRGLLALRAVQADAFVTALAEADVAARYATLAGRKPPVLATLYPHCAQATVHDAEDLESVLGVLLAAAEKIFTPYQSRRVVGLCQQLRSRPISLDAIPVQQFVAGFVRNTP